MNFKITVLEVLLAIILFIIMQLVKNKAKEETLIYLLPNIYLIIVASIFKELKNYTFIIIILYLLFDIINEYIISNKETLIDEKNYYKDTLLTFMISIIVYNFYLLKVEDAFIDMNQFKNFIWVLIILYIYQILKKSKKTNPKKEKNDYDVRFREYVILNYAKFKNKYSYLIKNKNKTIENVLYSFIIYENYINSGLNKYIKMIKHRLNNLNVYGIMQVNSDKYLSDEESIVITKNKVVNKYNKIKNNDINIIEELIKTKYSDKFVIKEIIKINDIIEDFNK